MNCPWCRNDETASEPARARGRAGLLAGVGSTVAPAAALVLMPKCPACIGAYLALATGVGVSVSTASYLKTGAIVVCVGWLGLVGVGVVRRIVR